MYTLEIYRVITSQHVWLKVGEFDSLEDCANELYSLYWLNCRVTDSDGNLYSVVESDYSDEDGCECVNFSFSKV